MKHHLTAAAPHAMPHIRLQESRNSAAAKGQPNVYAALPVATDVFAQRTP